MGKARRFTQDELDKITYDYKNGMRPKDLGIKYDRNSGTIIKKLQSLGIYKKVINNWTDDELSYLKEYYPKTDAHTLKKYLIRHSEKAIIGKAVALHLHKEDLPWNEDEVEILKSNYYWGNILNIVELLNNKYTYRAIQVKANSIGLLTKSFWSENEDNLLYEKYETSTKLELINLFPERTYHAIITRANSLGLKKENYNYTNEEDLYLTNNYQNMKHTDMAKVLNRTLYSVQGRCSNLRLIKTYDTLSYNNISDYIRKNNNEWKTESMVSCDYKCYLTGRKFNDIHHVYGFNLILDETLDELDIDKEKSFDNYKEDELNLILIMFIENQYKYPLGVCLNKDVHILFHQIYGYGNNTPDQWYRFEVDFKNGVYNDILEIKSA